MIDTLSVVTGYMEQMSCWQILQQNVNCVLLYDMQTSMKKNNCGRLVCVSFESLGDPCRR